MKRKRKRAPLLPLAVVLSLMLSLTACGAKKPPPPVEPKEGAGVDAGGALYDRLGGKEGIDAIADAFLVRLHADPRVSDFFKRGENRLAQFRQQLCQISGGPCLYKGKDMKTAHVHMGINDMQFDAFIEDLMLTLDEKGISAQSKSEILAALAPMRTQIVEKVQTKK